MDALDLYLAARCALLAELLDRLDDLPRENRLEVLQDAALVLDLVGEAMALAPVQAPAA